MSARSKAWWEARRLIHGTSFPIEAVEALILRVERAESLCAKGGDSLRATDHDDEGGTA